MLAILGYVLIGILTLVILALVIPVGVRVVYEDALRVTVSIFGLPLIRFTPNDQPKTPEKTDKPVTDNKQPLIDLSRSLKEDGVGATVRLIEQLARVAGTAFRRVLTAITVDRLRLQLTVASVDASATAQLHGRICAVLFPALTTVQAVLRIRRREVTVTPDFLAQNGSMRAFVTARAVPVRLLWAALCAWLAFRKLQKNQTVKPKEEQDNGQ